MKILNSSLSYLITTPLSGHFTIGYSTPEIPGDDPPSDTAQILTSLNKNAPVAWMRQVHGADIKIVDAPDRYECDGIFTSNDRLALVVKTADCLPIVLFSHALNITGVIHMGWRSAAARILDNIPFDLTTFTAIAGVGMRKCCYRVGREFLDHPGLKPFLTTAGEGYIFDPISFARHRLTVKGLPTENFMDIGICSCCSPQHFFSHRRDKTAHRTLTFIVT